MNILFFGDIVGKIGRKVVTNNLPILIKKYDIDFVICNAENVTKGKGLTKTDYFLLKESGIDILANTVSHVLLISCNKTVNASVLLRSIPV